MFRKGFLLIDPVDGGGLILWLQIKTCFNLDQDLSEFKVGTVGCDIDGVVLYWDTTCWLLIELSHLLYSRGLKGYPGGWGYVWYLTYE